MPISPKAPTFGAGAKICRAPDSSKWVANEWRNVWQVTSFCDTCFGGSLFNEFVNAQFVNMVSA
jgi:hypothetical protein